MIIISHTSEIDGHQVNLNINWGHVGEPGAIIARCHGLTWTSAAQDPLDDTGLSLLAEHNATQYVLTGVHAHPACPQLITWTLDGALTLETGSVEQAVAWATSTVLDRAGELQQKLFEHALKKMGEGIEELCFALRAAFDHGAYLVHTAKPANQLPLADNRADAVDDLELGMIAADKDTKALLGMLRDLKAGTLDPKVWQSLESACGRLRQERGY